MSLEEPLVNNGERLYYNNLAHGVLRQIKLEETRKNEEDNFTMEFSFTPRINKTENDKYSNIPSKFGKESIPIQRVEEINEDSSNKKGKSEEEIKKMTNRLYSESKKFKENKEKLCKEQTKEECPFTPKINVQGEADPKYFMMRLEKWKKKMEEKSKKNEDGQKKLEVDSETGQKLFHPKVEDPVAKKLKRENEDVHIDLYKKGLEHIDYRKTIMKTDTRDDLKKIEKEKLNKISRLKEERDRYKKEKQEKLEKKIQERTQKAKEEKENMEKIINERINSAKKEEDKSKNKKNEVKEEKDSKNKNKKKETKEEKDSKDKKIKKEDKEEKDSKSKNKKKEAKEEKD